MTAHSHLIAALVTTAFALATACQPRPDLVEQVRGAEIAFARTMADRDLKAFATFLDEEAVFVGSRATMRGRDAIVEGWQPFFEGSEAPFSWAPQTVEVLDSGTLALTAGPVLGPGGESLGTFNSVWRRGDDGRWRVIFDKGCPPCEKD